MQATARFAKEALPRLASAAGQPSRTMSSHGSPAENLKGMQMWTYVTYACIPALIVVGYRVLSQSHEHSHGGPKYPYLKKRERKFPWGTNCDLFDFDCGNEAHH